MTTPHFPLEYKAPDEQPDNARFWQGAREGLLMIKVCESCGKPHWYPRVLCPFCLGNTVWKAATGRGTIYAFSITRRAGPHPFCIAYVRLEEGVSMMTHIIDCDLDDVRIGQKVHVRFSPTDGGAHLPTFAPA